MMRIEIERECTPTLLLDRAVAGQLATSPALPTLQWGLTLRVVPKSTHDSAPPVTRDAWYDLTWSIPALCDHSNQGSRATTLPTCTVGYVDFFDEEEEPFVHEAWFDIAHAGVFSAPPEIPFEARLAATPEITEADVDDWENRQPGAIRFIGGRDKILELLKSNRVQAAMHNNTATRYDWTTHAAALLERYRALTPPKVSTKDRLKYAGVRLLRARLEEAAARQSAADLIRNAHQANKAAGDRAKPTGNKNDWARWTGVTRPTINTWLNIDATTDSTD